MYKNAVASCFLTIKNNKRRNLHYLQFESSEINDQERKEENDDAADSDGDAGGKGQQTKFKPKKIKIETIAKYLVGISTLEEKVTESKLIKYIKFTESHNEPTLNIWIFLCQFALLLLNMVGKNMKNDYTEEY